VSLNVNKITLRSCVSVNPAIVSLKLNDHVTPSVSWTVLHVHMSGRIRLITRPCSRVNQAELHDHVLLMHYCE
jgi:hypothetical protein